MANPRNEASVKQLRDLLADAQTFFLVDYQGLSAEELNVLRGQVKSVGGRILVAKNTLINVVLKERGVEGFDTTLKGPTALVLLGDDLVGPAKVLTDFAKNNAKDLPTAKGGLLQGAPLDAAGITRLSKLPSREQLLSEFLGVLQAPLQQLVGVLEGPQRNLVSVITNHKNNLEEA